MKSKPRYLEDPDLPLKDKTTKNPSSIVNFITSCSLPNLTLCLLFLASLPYLFYSLTFLYDYKARSHSPPTFIHIHHFHSSVNGARNHTALSLTSQSLPRPTEEDPKETPLNLSHIVFGIAGSRQLWYWRKHYIKLWFQPDQMRGFLWLNEEVRKGKDSHLLPPIKISGNTTKFKYENRGGDRSALRLTRVVSETFRLGLKDVRWFVMGDDDTVFVPENLVRVLSKYDHRQFYYIGSSSESHKQNIKFSYGMAYGGGGFAISYPLAEALEKMQDRCIQRYPELYGSDDRIHACMVELGVPLTKEPGFHQLDLHGSVFGLLAAHPVAPLVSLHHLDIVDPIFPSMNRLQALQKLMEPTRLDSAGLMQQSICYDKTRNWTVSVSWGYVVQIIRGKIRPREMEIPVSTFSNWYPQEGHKGYAFNTRPEAKDKCQKPFVYFLSNASYNSLTNYTASEYVRSGRIRRCRWKMADPYRMVRRVRVYMKPNPHLWDKSPRRNCCRVSSSPTRKGGTMMINVGECRSGEVIES